VTLLSETIARFSLIFVWSCHKLHIFSLSIFCKIISWNVFKYM